MVPWTKNLIPTLLPLLSGEGMVSKYWAQGILLHLESQEASHGHAAADDDVAVAATLSRLNYVHPPQLGAPTTTPTS